MTNAPASRESCGGRVSRVVLVTLLGACWVSSPAARAADPDNCLLCHQYRGLSRFDPQTGEVHLFSVSPQYVDQRLGPHARLACPDCHDRKDVSVIPHEAVPRVDCTRQCHLTDPNGLERRFSHANIAAMLGQSAHTPTALADVSLSHGPLLDPHQAICLYCHDEPMFRDPTRVIPVLGELGGRVFDRCEVCHAVTVPVDIKYYVRHIASRLQPARPSLELAQVCAVCHADPQFLKTTGLPDAVSSYVRSFHGKAALLGDQTTANCLSCHVGAGQNAHEMFRHTDPRSSVSAEHVADSCRTSSCHPGADPRLATFAVHLDLPTARTTLEFALAAAFILFTVLTFGPSATIVLLELGQILVGRHHHEHGERRELARTILRTPEGRKRLIRFTPFQRVQHWVLVLLFTLLGITGFPLKFADRPWAASVIHSFGGLFVARTIHHWAGILLIFGLFTHLVYIVATTVQRRRAQLAAGLHPGLVSSVTSLPMWVGPADGLKGLQLLRYLLGIGREPPTFGRFSVKEKFEYLGVFWGTMLLGLTGLLLWGQQFSSHFLSGRWLNIALIAHTYEAFLAVIHVGILHIINVIFSPNVFPLSLATITGRTPLTELAEGHGEMVEEVARDLGVAEEEEEGHA